MKMFSLTFLFLNFFIPAAHAAPPVLALQPDYSQAYDPERNPYDDGRAALELAKETKRRVLIEIGGDWCVYCHIFDRFIKSDQEVADKFFNTFVLLKVNYSDANPNKEFLSGFAGIDGYPYIFITENNGKVIYANDMREMTDKGKPNKEKMFAFLKRWKLE